MAASLPDVLRGVCPRCRTGRVSEGIFHMKRRCPNCDLNLYPEPGYYLGAMMAAFFITAVLIIPTILILKVSGAEPTTLIVAPLVQYLVFCPLITHYAKILWLHLEYNVTDRWEKESRRGGSRESETEKGDSVH